MLWKLKIAILFGILKLVVAEENPKVCINDGCLVGVKEKTRLGRVYDSFLGVPYAKPPIGDLRFMPPEKPDPWDILEAKKDGDACIQLTFFQTNDDPPSSEDCLYLNVFTPKIPVEGNSGKGLPVMVYFHPGGLMFWSGTRHFFGGNYLLDRDIVMVSINYRLNAFGFLSTEDEVCPGNWGLKDQTHALRWVRENIAAFGGDPDSVTIFGGSAGALSTHYHMLSPLSQGLFHRVIAQSGNALASWGIGVEGAARELSKDLGKQLNCPTQNSKILLECLRSKSVDDFMNADANFSPFVHPHVKYRPTVELDHEGAFLVGRPGDLIAAGKFADVPFLTGTNSKEGIILSAGIFSQNPSLENLEQLVQQPLPLNFHYHSMNAKRTAIDKIIDFYFDNGKPNTDKFEGLTDIISDLMFVYPLAESMKLQRVQQKSPIFLYNFEYKAPISFATIFGLPPTKTYNGTSHCNDMIYLFPLEKSVFKGYIHDEEGNAMIERILDLWTNFAAHGNPTPDGYDFTWNPVRSNSHEYLAIKGPNDLAMTSRFYNDRVAFWKELNFEAITSPVHKEL